jgi:hypothetical protein
MTRPYLCRGVAFAPVQVVDHAGTVDGDGGLRSVFEDAGEHELKGVPDRWHL